MNWPLAGLTIWLLVVLRMALAPLLLGEDGQMAHIPESLLILLAFVAFHALRPQAAFWCALTIGLMLDLTRPCIGPDGGHALIGPYALGALLALWVLRWLRERLFNESLPTLLVGVVVGGLVLHGTVLVIKLVRVKGFPGESIAGFTPLDALTGAGIELAMTLGLAVPLGWVLMKTRPFWGMGALPNERRFG